MESSLEEIKVGEEVIILEAGGLLKNSISHFIGFVGELRSVETYDLYATVYADSMLDGYVVVSKYIRATPLLKALC